MRAALFHEHGGPEVVVLEEVPIPTAAPDQVLIRVRAAAMNHLDLWVRRGIGIETTMPHIGGSDFAGVVEDIGGGVEGVSVGDRVVVNPSLWCGRCSQCSRGEESMCERFRLLGEHTDGGFAEFAVAPATNVYRLPPEFPFEHAAALPVSYQTAWRALLTRARLQAGEDVLILGASGGTAAAAVQIAKFSGARVYAVTSGEENVDRVRQLGADVVYDRERVDFSREVHRDTEKRGVDVVVENVGEVTWRGSMRALARGGRLVTYGATTGWKAETDLRLLFWKQLELIGTTMASRAEFEAMLKVALEGRFTPVIGATMALDDAREAHRRLESGNLFGKLILVP